MGPTRLARCNYLSAAPLVSGLSGDWGHAFRNAGAARRHNMNNMGCISTPGGLLRERSRRGSPGPKGRGGAYINRICLKGGTALERVQVMRRALHEGVVVPVCGSRHHLVDTHIVPEEVRPRGAFQSCDKQGGSCFSQVSRRRGLTGYAFEVQGLFVRLSLCPRRLRRSVERRKHR